MATGPLAVLVACDEQPPEPQRHGASCPADVGGSTPPAQDDRNDLGVACETPHSLRRELGAGIGDAGLVGAAAQRIKADEHADLRGRQPLHLLGMSVAACACMQTVDRSGVLLGEGDACQRVRERVGVALRRCAPVGALMLVVLPQCAAQRLERRFDAGSRLRIEPGPQLEHSFVVAAPSSAPSRPLAQEPLGRRLDAVCRFGFAQALTGGVGVVGGGSGDQLRAHLVGHASVAQ